ncbi:DUF397 domain-containing protein [Streptomyces sp. NPDC047000]
MEVAHGRPGATVPVRDSKAPLGPVLAFRPFAWGAFVSELKAGRHRL